MVKVFLIIFIHIFSFSICGLKIYSYENPCQVWNKSEESYIDTVKRLQLLHTNCQILLNIQFSDKTMPCMIDFLYAIYATNDYCVDSNVRTLKYYKIANYIEQLYLKRDTLRLMRSYKDFEYVGSRLSMYKKIAVIEDIAEQGPEFFCTFFFTMDDSTFQSSYRGGLKKRSELLSYNGVKFHDLTNEEWLEFRTSIMYHLHSYRFYTVIPHNGHWELFFNKYRFYGIDRIIERYLMPKEKYEDK
jgi:hypothetical protein